MAIADKTQYLRKASLYAINYSNTALDLSDLHFRFQTVQNDRESPANCSIRVHNMSEKTLQGLKSEFNRVVLNAGYENAAFGLIFDGTIKQFRVGREPDGVTNYVDLLLADGDLGYNWAFSNQTLAAGLTAKQRLDATIIDTNALGLKGDTSLVTMTDGKVGGILPRGKVLFGLTRGLIRSQVQNIGCTWSIQDGVIQVIPLDGYLPGDAVVLNATTGLIGRVEQTADGMKVRCLLNPLLVVGGTVKIDNASINQTFAQDPSVTNGAGQLAYNKYQNSVQLLADISNDGLYRIYVAEYTGDTRGQEWYTDITCLKIDPVTNKVNPNG
jgi:hypothetical protein